MKTDEQWVESLECWPTDRTTMATLARAIQADALRHAAQLCRNRPITITHRTLLEAADQKTRDAIKTHSSQATQLMAFTTKRTINLLVDTIKTEADALEKP